MYKYNERKQLAVARRAIRVAKKNNYSFAVVQMTKEKSESFSDSLRMGVTLIDNTPCHDAIPVIHEDRNESAPKFSKEKLEQYTQYFINARNSEDYYVIADD